MRTILNREFQHPADGWYQIEAKGNHPNREAGIVQVIDDEATKSIVNRFNAAAAQGTLRHGHEMLVDHEHFSSLNDQESRAYGWLQELQNRADGIYGRIRWTTTGKAAIDGGDYRFFSTEYAPKDMEVVANKSARPLELAGLSLTNMNNNRGQKPITNSARENAAATPEECARLFKSKVKNRMAARQEDFCTANDRVRQDNPALARAMRGEIVLNKVVLTEGGTASEIYDDAELEQYQEDLKAEKAAAPVVERIAPFEDQLRDWFRYVKTIQEASGKYKDDQLDFWQAFAMARKVKPDCYAALVAPLLESDDKGVTQEQARADWAALTKGMQNASGDSFDQVFNRCRREFPAIYNRLSTRPALKARTEPSAADRAARQAGAEFSKIVNRFKTEKGLSHDVAWNRARTENPDLVQRMNANRE